MKNGWIKYFATGECEFGWDNLVEAGAASWRKGKLNQMIAAQIQQYSSFHQQQYTIQISIPGEYWQSDDYRARLMGNKPELLCRRLEYRADRDIVFEKLGGKTWLGLLPATANKKYNPAQLIPLKQGQWLIGEIDIENNLLRTYISERRI